MVIYWRVKHWQHIDTNRREKKRKKQVRNIKYKFQNNNNFFKNKKNITIELHYARKNIRRAPLPRSHWVAIVKIIIQIWYEKKKENCVFYYIMVFIFLMNTIYCIIIKWVICSEKNFYSQCKTFFTTV